MTDRYLRHAMIDWFDQDKLQAARIVVVGAGAVGNEVLKNLVLLGVGSIHVIDFDRIENHNLTRCVLFRDGDLGQFKADVAASSCRQIDPNVKVHASHTDFWESLTLREIADSSAVVSCVDNFEARIRLNQLCMLARTDFYNTAIDSRFASVELFPFSERGQSACYECTLPASAYNAIQQRYSCGWLRKAGLEEKKIPTTAVTSSAAGAVVVSMLLHRLGGHPERLQDATRHFQDTIALSSRLSSIQRSPDCYACSSAPQRVYLTSAKRHLSASSIVPLAGNDAADITFSEPVLTRGECKLCGLELEFYESASRLSDAATICPSCGQSSISATFVERLNLADLAALFGDRQLPCKFVTISHNRRTIVIELED